MMLRQTNDQPSLSARATTTGDSDTDVSPEQRVPPDHARQPTAVAEPMIAQRQLDRYRHLTAMLAERNQLRQELVELLAAGASIESGPLSLAERTYYTRRLTQTKLREFIGDDGVDWILTQMEPKPSRVLTVREHGSGIRDTQSPENTQEPNGQAAAP